MPTGFDPDLSHSEIQKENLECEWKKGEYLGATQIDEVSSNSDNRLVRWAAVVRTAEGEVVELTSEYVKFPPSDSEDSN